MEKGDRILKVIGRLYSAISDRVHKRGPHKVWVTKDGRKIPIKRLTDEHLRNILRMLWRQFRGATGSQLAAYIRGPKPNGMVP